MATTTTASTTAASSVGQNLEKAFQRWIDAMEMESKYVIALGDYKRNQALGTLREAVAAGQIAKARHAEAVVRELEHAMLGVRRHRRKVTNLVRTIEMKAADVSLVRHGENLSPDLLGRMWAGLAFFSRLAPQEVLNKLSTTPIEKDVRDGANYCLVREPSVPCRSVPETVGSVGGLLAWMQTNRVMPRRGKPAFAQVTAAFSQVASGVEGYTKPLEASLREMEHGVLDAWKPMMLAILADDDVSKAIIKASLEDK
jgi:hypothetical protein